MEVDDLRGLFVLEGLTDDQLHQVLVAGDEVHFDAGDELFHEGEPATSWWVLLEGRVDLVRQAGREEPVVMMTMDRPGLWAGGFHAWDATSSYLATARAATAGRMFCMPSAALGEVSRAWFPSAVHLIEGFFQTVRRMDTLSRQRESLIALGTLAAGLAHEINTPASASARAVDALRDSCDELLQSLVQLAERSLPADRFVQLDALRREIDVTPTPADPLAVADREETLSTWLDAHAVRDAWRIAPPLAATGVDLDWFERAADVLEGDTLEPGLAWVAGVVSTQTLLSEVKESTARISALVDAVRSYSQLDRASFQLIDVTEGIESTLVMLRQKLGDGVDVVRDYAPDLPRIEARPGELNQVWTNLIDNAIDAMEGKGTLRISVRVEGDALVVEVGDTGAGMPPEVRGRAFEPFYTTKAIGKGTGLGLDISRRIVADGHRGRITIESEPGATVVTVCLPHPAG